MFGYDNKNLKQYIKNLHSLQKNAYPKVIRSVLDRMAFIGLKELKKNVKKSFTIRNASSNIILKSLRYEKCSNTLNISSMRAKTGQAETTFSKKTEQIRKQEYGEYIHSNKNHIMKPTKTARGGSYKRAVRQENLLSKIKVSRVEDLVLHPAKTEFKQFRQVMGYAKHNPSKTFYYLPSENSYFGINGIARVNGSQGQESAKFLYSIKDKTQKLKERPVVEPAGIEAAQQGEKIFIHEAERRITKELQKGTQKT